MLLWPLILLIFLLILSGLFSSLETAYTSLTPGQINQLAEHEGRRGLRVKKLTKSPGILLTTLLLGNNLANLGASALTATITMQLLGQVFIAATTGILTLLVLIFCEVTPKQIALASNENLCLRSAQLILILSWIFRPFIWCVETISRTLTHLFVGRIKKPLSLEQLLHHVKEAETEGIVESFEEEMIRNVFRINDTPVEAIMTHRTELFTMDEETSAQEALDAFLKAGYSRAPILRSGSEHVSGIVTLKNVASVIIESPNLPVKHIASSPYLVPGTMKAHELFFRLKTEPIHLAVVLDEYGGLDGVVTREDVMEEIFGELYNEKEAGIMSDPIVSDGKGAWVIQGDADFYTVSDVLGLHLEHDSRTHTMGGYLLEKLEYIPTPGTEITLPEGVYIVLQTTKNRICSVYFRPTGQNNNS